MATIKYDNSNVETRKQASPGVHLFKIVSVRDRSEEGKQDIEVILEVSEGKDKGARVWSYPGLTEATAWKFRQFTDALGMPPKGNLNTAKLVGKPIGGLITEDTWDGEYRARLKTFLDPEKVGAEDEEGEDLPEEEGDEVDLDALDLDELKEFIEEEELDIDADEVVGKSKGARAEAKLRAAIEEAMGEAEEDEDDEDDEGDEEDEEEAQDYSTMSLAELKAELKKRGLDPVTGKAKIIAALEANDEEADEDEDDEDEEGEESYEDMDLPDLVTLAKERGIKLTVKQKKDKQTIIDLLESADEDDEAEEDEEDEEPEPPKKGKATTKAKVAGKPAAKAVAAEEDDDEEDEDQEDYSDWDEDDLREELESRGLSVKGTKKVMITRLERDDSKSGAKPF